MWLFGHGLQVWDILGVNALGFVMTLAGSNLRHSHIPLHFGVAESLLISPAQHQLHHSVDHNHPNLGSFLSWWDRLCGSWMAGGEARNLRFGLSTRSSETSANTDTLTRGPVPLQSDISIGRSTVHYLFMLASQSS